MSEYKNRKIIDKMNNENSTLELQEQNSQLLQCIEVLKQTNEELNKEIEQLKSKIEQLEKQSMINMAMPKSKTKPSSRKKQTDD